MTAEETKREKARQLRYKKPIVRDINIETIRQKAKNDMAKMIFDEEGLLEEPCLSCDKAYVEDIWHEWCCDEKKCSRNEESEGKDGNI